MSIDRITRDIVVFDLGGVLIEWDPRHLYRRLFNGDEEAMENFLATVCTPEWNRCQDAGRSFAEAEAEAIARHPGQRALIEAWWEHFDEMAPGAIAGTVAVLARLRARGVPLYALSNWSAETFALSRPRFPFLEWFRGIVVSGQERLIKPDPRIFAILLERYAIDPARAVFIDDTQANTAAAEACGMQGIRFLSPEQLTADLEAAGLL
jgi:2-haloacid dehalogenase